MANENNEMQESGSAGGEAIHLTAIERVQISDVLRRRANEIAGFYSEYTRDSKHHGSVEMALSREMTRLRELAHRVAPPRSETTP